MHVNPLGLSTRLPSANFSFRRRNRKMQEARGFWVSTTPKGFDAPRRVERSGLFLILPLQDALSLNPNECESLSYGVVIVRISVAPADF